ncbi:MAG: phosphoribosylformylglycinamidine synthase [Clostridia bacterium]|nr:phosphoribosylformylglycinamidine synthase [Clostridia bacterium]
MVFRVFVEKKPEVAVEAKALLADVKDFLGIENITGIRVINRYDVENIDEELFEACKRTVFSEPQLDNIADSLPVEKNVFAVEMVPGQYDQRADSAAQCIQIMSCGNRPNVKTAKVYVLEGELSQEEIEKIKKYVINPVEAREASLELPDSLEVQYKIPESVETVEGFRKMSQDELAKLIEEKGLAMDLADISLCQEYFAQEQRDPSITEVKMIDTYWSDHCRHTTFNTTIDSVEFEDEVMQEAFQNYMDARKALGRTKPVNLMDMGTLAAKVLKKAGKLDGLDESEEINACTVKIKVEIEGKQEDWLLLFKNETHNHPTEIEPFGGAATCIGGCIRDPLSGRSYAYAAMRVTGAADPLKPLDETLQGKLPQRKIVTTAAAGYSSYGNQIGLATGQVDELYHPGYVAKRMEVGAVMAATPAENVRREVPTEGDVVILLGGRTGRDGVGGASGASKSHKLSSLEECGAEVQKGNAPEERKLQRLFRKAEASKMIKRCNDFGAGGVSVAIGELADGLDIDLNKVPKKYEGLDGTELAISESQERMAVVVEGKDADRFCELAAAENLEATVVAKVTKEPRLVLNWNGKKIVDLSRAFLDSNGAEKHISVKSPKAEMAKKNYDADFEKAYFDLAGDLNVCSKRGLSERFDSTIGAGTVLMPFGGKYQLTPAQSMAYKVSVEDRDTKTCSLMAYGCNPFVSEASPYHGAYLAVVESVCKLVANGAEFKDVYLSFQEYFEKLGKDPARWGKPFNALLGAFKAQVGLGVAAIGGKDSMSGTFEDIDVPPTLVSFAVTIEDIDNIVTNEFKAAGHKVILVKPEYDEEGLPTADSLLKNFDLVTKLQRAGKVCAAYTPTFGAVAEAVLKMAMGNGLGFEFDSALSMEDIFGYSYGAFVLEVADEALDGVGADFDAIVAGAVKVLGCTKDTGIAYQGKILSSEALLEKYEGKLEKVFPCNIKTEEKKIEKVSLDFKGERKAPSIKCAAPKVLIPVFPGTNCEFDSAKAMKFAGAEPKIMVIRNQNADDIARSIEEVAAEMKTSQMVFIPGGFSGGDEPDGSGKFITAFFRNPQIKEEVESLLEKRDGLMLGICNGFQALIKLGLVPYGKIMDTDENCPTLTFNDIARHQSKLVHTRIASNKSPWLADFKPGDTFTVPISHGEGKLIASEELVRKLAENGQIATQYADLNGEPTNDIRYNPNGSVWAIEGITSPDGRVFGKMGHAERKGYGLYQNVPGDHDMKMFESAVKYFK